MPAEDRYHKRVARALQKDDWQITADQVILRLPERHLWVDLRATRDNADILVEVKGFETVGSLVDYLATAIDQYSLYHGVLEALGVHIPLYMAVPIVAYETILSETLGQIAIRVAGVKLLVFDPLKAEIVKWIP